MQGYKTDVSVLPFIDLDAVFLFFRFLGLLRSGGDGTLRKMSSTEWKKWNVKLHLSLHKLQLRLLMR